MDGGLGFATAGLGSIVTVWAPSLVFTLASMKSVARTLTYLGLVVVPLLVFTTGFPARGAFFLPRHHGTSREMRLREASLMLIAALAEAWRDTEAGESPNTSLALRPEEGDSPSNSLGLRPEEGDSPSSSLGLRERSPPLPPVVVEVAEEWEDLLRKRNGERLLLLLLVLEWISAPARGDESRENLEPVNEPFFTMLLMVFVIADAGSMSLSAVS